MGKVEIKKGIIAFLADEQYEKIASLENVLNFCSVIVFLKVAYNLVACTLTS